MKGKWDYLIIGILGGLLGSGLLLLLNSPPRGEPVELIPAGTRAPLVVEVSGEVAQPGVYSLPLKSRIGDAIDAAGGVLPSADTSRINLAAFLEDGMRIHVPIYVTPQPTTEGGNSEPANQAPTFPININTATLDELQHLPGIGAVKAQSILNYREANGDFESIEEILNVTGIGPSTFEGIKDLIAVDEY